VKASVPFPLGLIFVSAILLSACAGSPVSQKKSVANRGMAQLHARAAGHGFGAVGAHDGADQIRQIGLHSVVIVRHGA